MKVKLIKSLTLVLVICLYKIQREIPKGVFMKKNVGLWIDHREAVIVMVTDMDEQITRIKSDSAKKTRMAGGSRQDGLQQTESVRDYKFANNLDQFYDDIFAQIRDADLIQIFGPGEAKGELEKCLVSKGFKEHIVEVETVDNMTENQIVAKVRERFSPSN
jgi:peptide subunit release factor 1 (eRF1)